MFKVRGGGRFTKYQRQRGSQCRQCGIGEVVLILNLIQPLVVKTCLDLLNASCPGESSILPPSPHPHPSPLIQLGQATLEDGDPHLSHALEIQRMRSWDVATALFYSPASQEPRALQAKCYCSRWDQMDCPDSLHLPSQVEHEGAPEIILAFPLLLCISARAPQIISIASPFRKRTVERARREGRWEKRTHELFLKKSEGQ